GGSGKSFEVKWNQVRKVVYVKYATHKILKILIN
ncbi:unnamed protein product, partial [marine sediment metagenome]